MFILVTKINHTPLRVSNDQTPLRPARVTKSCSGIHLSDQFFSNLRSINGSLPNLPALWVALPGSSTKFRVIIMAQQSQSYPALQRSTGLAQVAFAHLDGAVRLRDLHQSGSAKALLPPTGAVPEIVFLNTSGGLTGGDHLRYQVTLGPQCRAVATTQTAERAYCSETGPARLDVALQVGAGGWIDWLPQETILFDRSQLSRTTRIDLEDGAGCLAVETIILGRAAMGETVKTVELNDHRKIYRNGKPVWTEPLKLTSDSLQAGPAALANTRALATIVMVAPHVSDLLPRLRAQLNVPDTHAAASVMNDILVCRIMAPDGLPMTRQITQALSVLRDAPLPRVWPSLGGSR